MDEKKKSKFDELDFSDITGEEKIVPEPIMLPPVPRASEPPRSPVTSGLWLNGKSLGECTPEEVKEWAMLKLPHDSTTSLELSKLEDIKNKERVVNNILFLATQMEYFWVLDTKKIPKKYIQ